MSNHQKIILSFGANLGDRKQNILSAINKLALRKIITDHRVSDFIETKALLLPNSPNSWDVDFYNAVLSGYTTYSPEQLLESIKQIEVEIGRIEAPKWAPRKIDIDILFYGQRLINIDTIQIPHGEFLNRIFLIELLNQIEPNFIYPSRGKFCNKTIKEIKQELCYEH